MSDDDNAKRVPAAEPSSPVHPDEDGWESALANMPNLPAPTPPPAAAAEAAATESIAATEPAQDPGSVTAPMPPVVPVPAAAPVAPAPTPSAPAMPLHMQTHVPIHAPRIEIEPIPDYPRRKPQPLTGPLLSVYGALLWSFVIAGQFTTSWMSGAPLDEKWAVLTVFVATIVCGGIALRRAQAAAPVRAARFVGRAVFAFVGAFIAWVATIFVATLAGNFASRNHDVIIAFALTALAVTASVLGPRLTSPGPRIAPSHGRKVVQVMYWGGLAVVTLIAGAELVANG